MGSRSSVAVVALARWFVVVSVAIAPSAALAANWVVRDPGQVGDVVLDVGATGAAELSGIAWRDGTTYYAVSDNGGALFSLGLTLEATTGDVLDTDTTALFSAAGVSDGEGIAYRSATDTVFVSDEADASVREFSLIDGSLLASIAVPAVFSQFVANRSLESLSADPEFETLWTANEEALSADGEGSTVAAGTVVRLQRFDAMLAESGQWAYVVDPLPAGSTRLAAPVSGVVDLVALPGGDLLALERALGPSGFRIRLYQADVSRADDTSALSMLDGVVVAAAEKRLLWQSTGFSNFEGAALGPSLDGGGTSLTLIADNSSLGATAVRGLRLDRVCTVAPRTDCRTALGSKFSARRRGGDRDRLTWSWRKGAFEDLALFGSPELDDGGGFGFCVYDASATTATLAFEALLPSGDAWRRAGSSGLKFRRRDGFPDGITGARVKSGEQGRAAAKVAGKGALLGLSLAPATTNGAPLIVQLQRIGGAVASCLETLHDATRR